MNIEYKPVSGQEQHSTWRYSLVNVDNNWMLICLVGSVILILDDLASHMTTANEAKEALKFLAEFLTTVKKSVHSSKVSFFSHHYPHPRNVRYTCIVQSHLDSSHQVCLVAEWVAPSSIWLSLLGGKKYNRYGTISNLFPSMCNMLLICQLPDLNSHVGSVQVPLCI